MLRSTFYSFTTASRALAINQKSLDVVGQNISNLATPGYTRQRVDRYSVSSSKNGMYSSTTDRNVGQGVEMAGINQSRDPFLDIRFRKEAPKIGELDARLTVLEDIEKVFDETTMNGISSQMSDLVKQLQTLAGKTGQPEFEGIVKTSAELLTRLFNQFSDKLTGTRKEQEYNLENIAIPKVNDLLKGLDNVNKNIRNEQLNGGSPLELLDQRNLILDELSQYVKIDVKTTNVPVSPGVSYEEMTVSIVDEAGNGHVILDPKGYDEFSAVKDPTTGKYSIFVSNRNGTPPTDVTNKIPTGNFKGYIDMLNQSGEFDNSGTNIRGIGYYQGMLDELANEFATVMNTMNESVYEIKGDNTSTELIKGGPLFESKDGPGTPITAGNIKISKGWADNDYGIVSATWEQATIKDDTVAANGNILNMIAAFSKKQNFITNAGGTDVTLFKGTFQEMLSQTGNVLALEVKSSQTNLKNYIGVVNTISDQRDSISAVSLDEEGISLLQYQKSYNAAARLMTTLDEAIGTIINNMGVVGR